METETTSLTMREVVELMGVGYNALALVVGEVDTYRVATELLEALARERTNRNAILSGNVAEAKGY